MVGGAPQCKYSRTGAVTPTKMARLVEPYVIAYSRVMATKVIPKTELRDRIRAELAQLGDDSLLITERGQPLAVVVSVDRWNHLQAKLEDLEDAVAILETRIHGDTGRPAESAFVSIERHKTDVPGPARKTG